MRFTLLPSEVILFLRLDAAVAQALGVVACQQQLHRGEERLDELLFLVVQILPDALGHGNGRAFQLQHAKRDAVDIDHHVRALGVRLGIGGEDGHFLGDGEIIFVGMLPVNQVNRHRVFAYVGLHLHAVAQQAIDFEVAVVETFTGVTGGAFEDMQRLGNQPVVVALLVFQEDPQDFRLNVPVADALLPVAEIGVAQRVPKQFHHPLLGFAFDLADGAHVNRAVDF